MRRKGRERGGESSKPVLKLRLCVYVSERERGGIERKRSERQKVSLSRDCVGGEREGGRQQIDK
jgi:hypothetical protein